MKTLNFLCTIVLYTTFFILPFGIIKAASECDNLNFPIHLTFDDGPHPINTPKILDILKKHNIKATFFVLGQTATKSQKHMKLVQRAFDEGHIVAWHTYKHIQHSKASPETVSKNMKFPEAPLGNYLDRYIRMPYGDGLKSAVVKRQFTVNNFDHVGWDIDPEDWKAANKENLINIALKRICATKNKSNGGVLLLHDIQANTAEKLDNLIQAIKKQGHFFVDMAEIVKRKHEGASFRSISSKIKPPTQRGLIGPDCVDCVDQYGRKNALEEVDETLKKSYDLL